MRHPTGRIFTVFPFLVLIILSFLVFFAEGTASSSPELVVRHSRQFAAKRYLAARQGTDQPGDGNDGGNDDGPGSGPSASGTARTTSSPSSTRSSVTSTSSSTSRTSLTSFTFSASDSSSSSIVTPSTTSSLEESSASTTSTSTSLRTSSTSTSRSSSTSRTSSSSSSRTTLQVTDIPLSTATSIVIATDIQGKTTSSSTRSTTQTSAAASNSETASSNGFLSNTGAMAGTFTALGIVVLGGICAVFIIIRKKRRTRDLDIFDTEYKEYSSGNDLGGAAASDDNYYASDMSSLSANAVTHAGAHTTRADYSQMDYGFGPPPTVGTGSNRTSVASNHAGFGAFRAATEQRKPAMQSSGLRAETSWNSDAAYAEPAVDEDQSIYVVPNSNKPLYARAVRETGMAH